MFPHMYCMLYTYSPNQSARLWTFCFIVVISLLFPLSAIISGSFWIVKHPHFKINGNELLVFLKQSSVWADRIVSEILNSMLCVMVKHLHCKLDLYLEWGWSSDIPQYQQIENTKTNRDLFCLSGLYDIPISPKLIDLCFSDTFLIFVSFTTAHE